MYGRETRESFPDLNLAAVRFVTYAPTITESMKNLVLLGDSIFDNVKYVEGGPAVIDQVIERLASNWTASLLAVDGDTASMAFARISTIPEFATHMVLSVGGNDALNCLPGLEASATSLKQGLGWLCKIQTDFRGSYKALVETLMTRGKPLMVCTINDSVPGMPRELATALGLFNDVILSEAIRHGLPVLDLRRICTEPGDYSAVSPIEPSSSGGAKIAEKMVLAIAQHHFAERRCIVYA